jgi:tetratricopeptide (TPR) repeat protein
METGDFVKAERAMNNYLAWAYRLNELEPGKPEWLMEKSYAHSNLAALIIREGGGEVESALVHIQQAGEIIRQVIELAPDNSNYLSEYGEHMAWLADTRLLACDLGNALKARQKNVEIAGRLVERSPGNTHYRSRYAYSLTGLAKVASQVGLLEMAIENLTTGRDILGQLSLTDPSNVDLRFGYLEREFEIAELMVSARRSVG